RRPGDRLHRSAGHPARPVAPAVPLELRHTAMRLEASRRAVPAWPERQRARVRRAAQRLGVPAGVPVPRTDRRPVVRLVARDGVPEPGAARGGVRDAEPPAGGRLLSGLPCSRLAGRDRRLTARAGRREGTRMAGTAAAVRVSANTLRGRGEGRPGGGPGTRPRLGQASAQGHRRAAAGRLMRSIRFWSLALVVLFALLQSVPRTSAAQGWGGTVRAGTIRFSDSTSGGALGGVIEDKPLGWLELGAAPTLVRSTTGSSTASGVGDLPLSLAAST